MRLAFKILIWLVIAVWFIAVMGFVDSEVDEVICSRVDIVLKDSIMDRFVSASDVRNQIEKYESGIQGYPVKDINTRKLEGEIEINPYIKNAEVYYDVTGRLCVEIYQRQPLVRIMPEGGKGFYIDRDGVFLPLSSNHSAYVILANGKIRVPAEFKTNPSIASFNDEQKKQYRRLIDIYNFSTYISGHPFWSSQIVQIYVNGKGEYEMIPRVGAHQILLGDMEHFEIKLKNLEALYNQGLSRYGWNTYEKINLKYLNQVICTKR